MSENETTIVTPIKYRTIDDILKRNLVEEERKNWEAQHYRLNLRHTIISGLNDNSDQHNSDLEQLRDQIALAESMITGYEQEYIGLTDEIEKTKKNEKE